jgi:hypothetical protein
MSLSERFRLAARALIKGSAPPPAYRDIPAITMQEVEEAQQFFPLAKFFIFGHARSGTTLLTRLVRVHPKVHCNYQGHFFTRAPLLEGLVANHEIEKWLTRNSNRWNRGRDLSPVVLRAVCDFIMERDARHAGIFDHGCVVGDKSPNSLLDGEAVQKLVKVYPDARLVFVIRDGRDAVVSHRFQAFIDRSHHLSGEDAQIRSDFARQPEPFLNGERSIFTEKGLRRSAQGWARNVVETDQIARQLLGNRYYHLRYEDLLAQPWEQMSKLWSFLDVNPDLEGAREALDAELKRNPDADWQRQKADDIASSLQKGQRGTWRELFTPRDRKIFKAAAGQALVDWGYERSLDW